MPPVFGLVPTYRGRSRGRGGNSHYGRSRGSFYRGRGRGRNDGQNTNVPARGDDGSLLEERFESIRIYDEIDEKLGFGRVQEGSAREGWLVNMHPVREGLSRTIPHLCSTDDDTDRRMGVRKGRSRLLLYSRRWWHVQMHIRLRSVLLHRMQSKSSRFIVSTHSIGIGWP